MQQEKFEIELKDKENQFERELKYYEVSPLFIYFLLLTKSNNVKYIFIKNLNICLVHLAKEVKHVYSMCDPEMSLDKMLVSLCNMPW